MSRGSQDMITFHDGNLNPLFILYENPAEVPTEFNMFKLVVAGFLISPLEQQLYYENFSLLGIRPLYDNVHWLAKTEIRAFDSIGKMIYTSTHPERIFMFTSPWRGLLNLS